MTSAEPTLGEVLRRLDDLSRQMLDLVREIKEDRSATAATYVRQDVYIAQRQADAAVVADLSGDVRAVNKARETDAGFRRQAWLTMAGVAITSLVAVALAIINILAR